MVCDIPKSQILIESASFQNVFSLCRFFTPTTESLERMGRSLLQSTKYWKSGYFGMFFDEQLHPTVQVH